MGGLHMVVTLLDEPSTRGLRGWGGPGKAHGVKGQLWSGEAPSLSASPQAIRGRWPLGSGICAQ